jgi:hypothetical protein
MRLRKTRKQEFRKTRKTTAAGAAQAILSRRYRSRIFKCR